VGEVSVGIGAEDLRRRLFELLRNAAAFMGLALLAGTGGAVLLARHLKSQTLGLEPADLADLLREQEAVVHGVQDGVLAVDTSGRITVCNDAARRLLNTPLTPGTSIADAAVPARLRDVIEGRRPVRGMLTVAGDHVLVVTSHQVVRGGRDLGVVLTLRDRTDLDEMGRELDAVRALSDALRAQAHEYTNRLHTVAGLLQIGHTEEAKSYLGQLTADPLATENAESGRLADPYVRGLLAAKTAAASELGVRLRLADEADLHATLTAPLDVVTVLGNLVDNAVTAARSGRRRPAWVEISLVADGDRLLLAVTDSGDGVPDSLAGRVFEDGFTTSSDRAHPHGVGLALARQVARSHRGDVELLRHAGPDHGAVFAARLEGVLAPTQLAEAAPDRPA
jgi:two-component system CitB family sensor kinase